jgi:hypothetical protein
MTTPTTKTFLLFVNIADSDASLTFTVQPGDQTLELELAIRNGSWWCDPTNLNVQYHLAGIAKYAVTSP